jgi:hypothetical protein
MNPQILCSWLALPGGCWPPDHHTLLGLPADETDLARIEQKVQERMAKLRGYQLSHPEEATEGMNRLAQAFIQLTENRAQTEVNGSAAVATAVQEKPASRPARATDDETAITQKTKLDWKDAPPPVRTPTKDTPLPPVPVAVLEALPVPKAPIPVRPVVADPAPPSEEEVARGIAESPEARNGLVTLNDVIERSDRTRHLLVAWGQAGRYLANPARKLHKPTEKADFARRLDALHEAADNYPGFVGHPGKPGYRVVAFARLLMTPEMFNSMDDDQRALLARDWSLANKVLLAHRSVLCRRFRKLRGCSMLGQAFHALRYTVAQRPTLWKVLGVALGVVVLASAGILLIMG